jgi:transcriptional regulator with XRE-family HTH domain
MDHDPSLPRTTGQLVRDARKHRKLSRRRVATNAGFSTRELAAAERGRRPLTVDELRSLSGSLGVELDILLPEGCSVEEMPPPDDIRIEDLLQPAARSPELEAALGTSARGGDARELVERRQAPVASARLARAFADLRSRSDAVTRCCALVQSAEATDDLPARLAQLQEALSELDGDTAFTDSLARYRDALEEYQRSAQLASTRSWRTRTASPATANRPA